MSLAPLPDARGYQIKYAMAGDVLQSLLQIRGRRLTTAGIHTSILLIIQA